MGEALLLEILIKQMWLRPDIEPHSNRSVLSD
jgi:hypothetical protein